MSIKTISLDGKDIIEFHYDESKEEDLSAFDDFANEYKRLINYFDKRPPKFKVKFAYSGKEFDEFCGIKDSTFVAMIDNKDTSLVYMLCPSMFEKEVKISRRAMLRVLSHEASHMFVGEISGRCFAWMNEGICEVASGNRFSNKVNKLNWDKFKNEIIDVNVCWYDQAAHQGYEISYNLVKYIIDKCGKEAMFDLLRIRRAKSDTIKSRISKIIGKQLDDFISEFEKTLILSNSAQD